MMTSTDPIHLLVNAFQTADKRGATKVTYHCKIVMGCKQNASRSQVLSFFLCVATGMRYVPNS